MIATGTLANNATHRTGLPQLLPGEPILPLCGEKCQPRPSQYQQDVDEGVHTPFAGLNLTAHQRPQVSNHGRVFQQIVSGNPG